MPSVFISYTQHDREAARRIAYALEKHAVTVWLDQHQILPGDALRPKIEDAIHVSDYFVIILSRSSLKSKWVTRELEVALQHNADAARRRIIPVRVDEVPIPPQLAEFRYIDLVEDFEDGIAEIVRTVSSDEAKGAASLGQVVDIEAVVRNTEETEKQYKGSGYGVTTILSIITIIVTLATAGPAFYQAFLERSKVYFAVNEERLNFPAHIDQAKLSALLVQGGIPSGYVRVQIMNRGTTSAKKVSGSVEVPGRIVDFSTAPPAEPQPVWVRIQKDIDLAKYPASVRLQLTDLVPERVLTSTITYHQTGDVKQTSRIEVVADGELATRVNRVEDAPQLTFWSYFEMPAKVLGVGLLLTLIAGLIAVIRRNREVAEALLLLAKELNPFVSYVVSALRKLL